MKILIAYYSMFGHIFEMARGVKAGAETVDGAVVKLKKIPETLPGEVLEEMGAVDAKSEQEDVPVCAVDDLVAADAIIFGTPTRFGNMCGQMKQFLDATGSLWADGSLVGKVGSVFTSSNTQHGGQESTILSSHIPLLHQGLIVVGLPYSFEGQMEIGEISGCSPYGASTIAGPDGERRPTDNELAGAHFQGQYVAKITAKLAA